MLLGKYFKKLNCQKLSVGTCYKNCRLTMTLPNNDNSLSVQRWTWASTIERMKFVSSNMLEATQNIGSLVAHLVKETACQCRRRGFNPWIGKFPWRRKWQPTPVFLPRKLHGQRSLAGYSPWGCKESDTTEHSCTHTHKDDQRLPTTL